MHLLFVVDVESGRLKKTLTENFVYKTLLHYVEKNGKNLFWDFVFSRRSTMIKLKKEPVFSRIMKNEVLSFKTTFTNILLKLTDKDRKRPHSFSFSTPLKSVKTVEKSNLKGLKIFEKVFEYYKDLSEAKNEVLDIYYVVEFGRESVFEANFSILPLFKNINFYMVNTVCLNACLEKTQNSNICVYKNGLFDLIHCFYYDMGYCINNKVFDQTPTNNKIETIYTVSNFSNKENHINFLSMKKFLISELSRNEHVFCSESFKQRHKKQNNNNNKSVSVSDVSASSHCISEAAIHDSATKNSNKCMVADCTECVNKFLFYERKINLNNNKRRLLDNLMSSVFTNIDDLLANKFNYSTHNQVLNSLKQSVYRIVVYDKFFELLKNDKRLSDRFLNEISTLFHHVALHAGPHFILNQLKNYILPKFDLAAKHLKDLFDFVYAKLNVEKPFDLHNCTAETYNSSGSECSSESSFNSSTHKNNSRAKNKFDEKVLLKKRPNLYKSSGQVTVLGQKRKIAATSSTFSDANHNNNNNSNNRNLPVKRVLFSKSTSDFKPNRRVSQLIDNHLKFAASSDESFSNSPNDHFKKTNTANLASWTPLKLYNMNNASSNDNNNSSSNKNDENVQEVEKVSVNSLISPYKVRKFENTNSPKEQPKKTNN